MDSSIKSNSSIKRIDKTTVHNICSGQVITNLRTAVKELVENSLDAGATVVEVHLRDHGTASIEVVDNGDGIHQDNFESIGLKHHTSKLRQFDDLPGVSTFGFRGEALGSLCTLADVVMVTRHGSADVGHRLCFSRDGRLRERLPAPRQVGTTVTVRQLFAPLPVRRREFCGRARRELTDLLHMLWGYALVTVGVRLTCTQQTSDGKRSVLLSSSGDASLSGRLAGLFGQKQLSSLVALRSTVPSEATRAEFCLPGAESPPAITVQGVISSCEHGKGRSSSDRQFISVNGRPCDYTKITRLVNEVYRTYNRHQAPFFVIDLTLTREHVDVNVTPDKRMLFVQNEKFLLASIKETLSQCFEQLPSSYTVTSHGAGVQAPASRAVTSPATVTSRPLSGDWVSAIKRSVTKTEPPAAQTKRQCLDRFFRRLSASPCASVSTDVSAPTDPGGRLGNYRRAAETPTRSCDVSPSPVDDECSVVEQAVGSVVADSSSPWSDRAEGATSCSGAAPAVVLTGDIGGPGSAVTVGVQVPICAPADGPLRARTGDGAGASGDDARAGGDDAKAGGDGAGTGGEVARAGGDGAGTGGEGARVAGVRAGAGGDGAEEALTGALSGLTDEEQATLTEVLSEPTGEDEDCPSTRGCRAGPCDASRSDGVDWRSRVPEAPTDPSTGHCVSRTTSPREHSAAPASSDSGPADRRRVAMRFSLDNLRCQVAALAAPDPAAHASRLFRAKIQPSENAAAEEELRLRIKKEDFLQMEVLGQFNLGFLVTRLRQDLFLIDQHASDEKFNFERLSRQALATQPLVVPQELQLPAVSEETLLSERRLFSEAGFHVSVDETAPAGRRLRLLAAPVVQGTVCGRADLEELIWLLQESSGLVTSLRPSRVRAVLASRACRTSVMIGTALSPAGMVRLVRNMAEMDHPWNCPHGRPTMRHLVCLDMIKTAP